MTTKTFNKDQLNYSNRTFSQTAKNLGLDLNELPDRIEVVNENTHFVAQFGSYVVDVDGNAIYSVSDIFNASGDRMPPSGSSFHLVVEG